MSAGGKGDKRIRESKPGSFAQGYDLIYKCPVCGDAKWKCGCVPTEDGPGQDGEDKERSKS